MNTFIVAFLLTFMYQNANGRPGDTVELNGTLGESIVLPCWNTMVNVTPTLTQWKKNGNLIIDSNNSKIITPSVEDHLAILSNQSLYINVLAVSDEGKYICETSPNYDNNQTTVNLQIVSGPGNVSIYIGQAKPLSNGTLYIQNGSTLIFNCSSLSYPSSSLSWGFHGVASSNDSLVVGNGSWLVFSIEDIQPKDQGNYSCTAQNSISHKSFTLMKELLVYYPPERLPECTWKVENDQSHVQFNCMWFGGYPAPTLLWGESHHLPGSKVVGQLREKSETTNLVLTLNRSSLMEEEVLRCYGHHPTIEPEVENFCEFILKSPFPSGEPMMTALEGTNATLVCTESTSIPPANTTWRKTIQQEVVLPSAKYVLSEEGPIFTLTIVNVVKEDEGFYFCRSENPVMVRELEIRLTVKDSSQSAGAVIGVFLAIMVIGSGVVIAKLLYARRDRICLGHGFGQMQEESGDVISLVDSDEEVVFEEAVPRLPPEPLANGHSTTFVQIHRIPSNDHEDTEVVGHPLQLENSLDVEELVTF
ncbi:hypothetical protein UPYG_G00179730 [Umbra pygmaea]|uniref:Ig-like domain-containing protein n=1 Tax=Umbra pygmaea TaxID=75934 RepID=A0ABD0WRV6_UMBPY